MGKLPIKNWPEEERPREKLVKFGKEHLTSCELLAIIIGTGCMKDSQSYSALDLASSLVSKYKNLKGMLDLSITELSEIKGIGMVKAVQILAAFELGKRAVSEKNGNNTSFRCSEEVASYYIPLMKDLKKEQFRVIMLNIKNKIIKEILISQGSLTSSLARLVKLFFSGKVKSMA
ncbi:MAG: hypothetical protein IMZ70_04465, partial [Candidatus Atribacteria bacterium]|nr:hypothetical protein [Candidatus Atribacteria bacterium]